MAFTVIYDACVLYPAPLRDLLIRIGSKGLVRARWTDQILDECFRNILANRPDLHPDDFVTHQIDLAPGLVCSIITEQATALKSPPRTVGDVLDSPRECSLVRSVARLRELFGP